MFKTELEKLKKKRDGYVMRKDKIEIKCTDKFVKYWERHGFEVVERKKISLVS